MCVFYIQQIWNQRKVVWRRSLWWQYCLCLYLTAITSIPHHFLSNASLLLLI